MASKANSITAIYYALTANFAVFVAKAVAAFLTGSSVMLAETVHSLAACSNQLLLLTGLRAAKRPATADFPLGFGKAINFWSFVVAQVLFTMGGMFALFHGVYKLSHPQPLKHAALAVLVLAFGVIAESLSMRACVNEINKVRGDRSFWRWFKESRQSELIVLFGEDFAALLGLAVALIAVSLTWVTGNPVYDAAGSIVIGVLLLVIAIFIAVEVKSLLIGQSADPYVRDGIIKYLEDAPEVDRVLNLITLQMGADVLVAVKCKMRSYAGADFMIAAINRVEAGLRTAFPEVRFLFFEPDVIV